jgi:hypothetical protein
MTVEELKVRLDDSLMSRIILLAKDSMPDNSKKGQLRSMLFHHITYGLYWDCADNELEL